MTDILFYLKLYTDSSQMFECDDDYQRCLENFEINSKKYVAKIHAYCMLPTSCHLLIETGSPFLKQFSTAISKAIKTVNKPKFRSVIIEKNTLSAEVSFYIHALPYFIGLELDPAAYPWSSLNYYCSAKQKNSWIEIDSILSQISSRYITAYKDYNSKFQSFILDPSIFFTDKLIKNMLDSKIIGSKKFKNLMTRLDTNGSSGGLKTISLEQINNLVEKNCENSENYKLPAKIYLSYLYSGMTNSKTGNFFGTVSASRVTQIVNEARLKIADDVEFKNFIELLENQIEAIRKKL